MRVRTGGRLHALGFSLDQKKVGVGPSVWSYIHIYVCTYTFAHIHLLHWLTPYVAYGVCTHAHVCANANARGICQGARPLRSQTYVSPSQEQVGFEIQSSARHCPPQKTYSIFNPFLPPLPLSPSPALPPYVSLSFSLSLSQSLSLALRPFSASNTKRHLSLPPLPAPPPPLLLLLQGRIAWALPLISPW